MCAQLGRHPQGDFNVTVLPKRPAYTVQKHYKYRNITILESTILRRLEKIRTESFEIVEPRRLAAPAAIAQVPIFTNGAVGSRIPDSATWAKALRQDPMTNLLLEMVANPALADTEENVRHLHHIYRQPARQGVFSVRDAG